MAIGHLTIDLLEGGSRAGGAAFFASRAAHAMGLRAGVVTSFDTSFPFRRELVDLAVEVVPSRASTRFENRYGAAGRQQWLTSLAEPIDLGQLPERFRRAPIVYLCPVMGEVELDLGWLAPQAITALGAQGWLRQSEASGRVRPQPWHPSPQALSRADLVVLSDEDTQADAELVPYLIQHVRLVVHTHGADGCELFVRGDRHQIPAFPTTQADPTGAGDVFGAAMLAALFWGHAPLAAAQLASCAASIVVEAPGGDALARVGECWDRLGRYGEIYGVAVAQRPRDEDSSSS